MKRMPFDKYLAKCGGLKKSPKSKEDYEKLDDDGYAGETEGMDKAGGDEDEEEAEDDKDEGEPGHEKKETGAEEHAEQVSTGDEDEEDDEDEDEEKSKKAKKSQQLDLLPSEQELLKACELVRDAANALPAAAKQNRLAELSKSASEGTISDADRTELIALLTPAPTGASENMNKSMSVPGMREAIDGSEYLMVHAEATTKSMGALEAEIHKSGDAMQSFFARQAEGFDRLAKALVENNRQQRQLIKSLSAENAALVARVETLEHAPLPYKGQAQAPVTVSKSQVQGSPRDGGSVTALQKASQLSRSHVMGALDELHKSTDRSDPIHALASRAIQDLDLSKSADWRSIVTDPELLARVVETK